MLEKQGLCSNGACATGSKEFRASDDQVNDEQEQFAHGANATTIGLAGKTARKARYERQFINSPSTGTPSPFQYSETIPGSMGEFMADEICSKSK